MWREIVVSFKLKSPLHIGYIPFKGSVISPTRYYVPGRNLWGAVTKHITEYLHKNPIAEDYRNIGAMVKDNFRFSYFYVYDGMNINFPRYTEQGLKYGNISRSEFEHKFIGSQISTAIDTTGTAKSESLHEIEFIDNKFKDSNGNIRDVKIIGCVWVREDAEIDDKKIIGSSKEGILIDKFNIIEELILGGESKYGFGHVLFDPIDGARLPITTCGTEELKIKLDGNCIIAHLKYGKGVKFKGDVELLTGRGYYDPKVSDGKIRDKPGRAISKPEFYFSPGTYIDSGSTTYVVNWDGTWAEDITLLEFIVAVDESFM
ncbi:MAG TPA: hypothetical protein PLR73_11870 [Acetivibrio sp.]|nr:hypothetical protein [Acetivibrio sp.]